MSKPYAWKKRDGTPATPDKRPWWFPQRRSRKVKVHELPPFPTKEQFAQWGRWLKLNNKP